LNMRVKRVRDLAALKQLEQVYKARGLNVIWTSPGRFEVYDTAGKLKAVAESKH